LRTKWDSRSSPPLIEKPLKWSFWNIPKAETWNRHLSLFKAKLWIDLTETLKSNLFSSEDYSNLPFKLCRNGKLCVWATKSLTNITVTIGYCKFSRIWKIWNPDEAYNSC
jgi:hypothetical protein